MDVTLREGTPSGVKGWITGFTQRRSYLVRREESSGEIGISFIKTIPQEERFGEKSLGIDLSMRFTKSLDKAVQNMESPK
ncbi:Hypothetical protein FKW44_019974, partial [Caligus rogercresseyi]